jgi:CBS domain-containing protein
MTTNLDTVDPKTDIAEAAEHMARLKIRHLPVVSEGELAGIISIRDLTNWAVHELTAGHELPDLERSHTALSAAAEVNRVGQ